MRLRSLLPLLGLASAIPIAALTLVTGSGCDSTNPDDFDAGPDAAIVHPDAGGDATSDDGASDGGFDAAFDGANPFACSPPCKADEYCYGTIFYVTKDVLDGGADDAGDAGPSDAASGFDAAAGFVCRPLPAGCAANATCTCVGDAAAPDCVSGTIFCEDDAGVAITCAQGGGP